MVEKFEHLAHTILKIWRGEENESEKQETQEFIRSSATYKEWIERLSTEEYLDRALHEYNNVDMAEAQRTIWKKIQMVEQEKLETQRRYSRIAIRLVVAAAVFIALGIAIWYMLPKPPQESSLGGIVKKSLTPPNTPDTAGIRLALADGSEYTIHEQQKDQTLSVNYGVFIKQNRLVFDEKVNLNKKSKSAYHKLMIPRGGHFQLELSDGTNVWLNSESSICFPAEDTGKTRKATITGEAYLEVKKDKARPFIISLPNGTIAKVLGTSFNINAYSDEPYIAMTLIEGSININNAGIYTLLKPLQQARIYEKVVKVKDSINISKIIAWKEGDFNFDNDRLTTVVRQLARWYNLQVKYIDTPTVRVSYFYPRSLPIETTISNMKGANPSIHMDLSINKDTLIVRR